MASKDASNDIPNPSTAASTTSPSTKPTEPTKKKTKKKKNTPLYQETAVKYYNGFTKNKRFNKGINLSTGCAIFKTAWELPENNGLILPSRVIRHFKQVLPKKPKQNKTKKNAKKPANKSNTNPSLNPTRSAMPSSIATASISSSISPKMNTSKSVHTASYDVRSRTMVDLHIPKDIKEDIDDMKHEEELDKLQMQQRRTIVSVASTGMTQKGISSQSAMDNIENLRDTEQSDEQSFDEQEAKSLKRAAKSMSMANLGITLSSSITSETPDFSFVDHADDLQYDLKPDTEELPVSSMDRANTDVKHMDLDMVSFKAEMLKMNSTETDDINHEKKEDNKVSTDNDKKKETKEKKEPKEVKPKTKTTKKKKQQVLYAEDATKLFKKINDGKRFKNGINLSKACNIFSVAWELPEENGRILPSKVARHFKQALPSKKTAKKSTKNKGNKAAAKNIKPSSIAKARTNRDNAPLSISLTEEDKDHDQEMNLRASTMRGHAPNGTWVASKSFQVMPRASARVDFVNKKISDLPSMQPKKSVISHLEDLISADPNRSKADDVEKNTIKRVRAGSMTDLHDMLDENETDIPDDHVVENDIDDLYKEVKRQKSLEKKEKEKEQNVSNAIDAALGI